MMSPTRSALSCTICSDSSCCVRRLSQPKMPKMAAVLATSAMASFTVRPARNVEDAEFAFTSGFREDGELFHRQPENSESEGDDGERYSYFRPSGNVMGSGRTFHSGDTDVQAVGDETEDRQHGAPV